MAKKICRKCSANKDLLKDRTKYICRQCNAKKFLWVRYKVRPALYESLYKEQLGMCAICKGTNTDGRRLHIDHDHLTGTIRGLLCLRCNFALGHLRDNIDLIKSAAVYLEKFLPTEGEHNTLVK